MTCLRCQHGNTKKYGRFGKEKTQRYRCRDCGATFSEPRIRPLGSHHTDLDTAARVLELLLEGMSVRAASRVTGLHKNTILDLMVTASENCRRVFDARMRGLRVRYVQADEAWTLVFKKSKRVKPGDPKEWGDAYLCGRCSTYSPRGSTSAAPTDGSASRPRWRPGLRTVSGRSGSSWRGQHGVSPLPAELRHHPPSVTCAHRSMATLLKEQAQRGSASWGTYWLRARFARTTASDALASPVSVMPSIRYEYGMPGAAVVSTKR